MVDAGGIRFSREISLGHLLTVVTMVISVIVYGLRLEGEMRIVELRVKVLETRSDVTENRINSTIDSVKAVLEQSRVNGELLRELVESGRRK